jgi:hypothetical protein
MQALSLRHVLVMDWTAIENTPPALRRPLEMQRWHFRAERLAELVDRPVDEVAVELKEAARAEAERQRREMVAALAEDLAVCRAQGMPTKPPWRRKLRTLAEISGQSLEVMADRVANAASGIQVVEVNQ